MRGGAPRHKVAHQLRGGFVVAAAQHIGVRLQLALQHHARQRVVRLTGSQLRVDAAAQRGFEGRGIHRKVAGVNAHHNAGVGVAFVARVLAHAVGHHAPGLGGGRYHRAAGAHAKTVDRASVRCVVHQLVLRRPQQRVAGVAAPTGAVNQPLRVLNAKADGERLGLQVDAACVQHGKGIARAVAQRHDHVAGVEFIGGVVAGVQHAKATQLLGAAMGVCGDGREQHIGHALLKTNLAA